MSYERSIAKSLDEAKVPYTTEPCMSNGFWGTRFIFETRKAAEAAQKVLPRISVMRFYKRFAIAIY